MAKILEVVETTCPFCNHVYNRNIYIRTKVSVCPKCRKRSDARGQPPGRYGSPKEREKKCKLCGKLFVTYSAAMQYCSNECARIVRLERMKIAAKKRREKLKKQVNE